MFIDWINVDDPPDSHIPLFQNVIFSAFASLICCSICNKNQCYWLDLKYTPKKIPLSYALIVVPVDWWIEIHVLDQNLVCNSANWTNGRFRSSKIPWNLKFIPEGGFSFVWFPVEWTWFSRCFIRIFPPNHCSSNWIRIN